MSLVIGKNNTGKTSLLNVLGSFLGNAHSSFAYEDLSLPLQTLLLNALTPVIPVSPSTVAEITLDLHLQYDDNDNLRDLAKLMVDLRPEARHINLRYKSELTESEYHKLHSDIRAAISQIEQATQTLSEVQRTEEIRRFLSKNLGSYFSRSVKSYGTSGDDESVDVTGENALLHRIITFEYISARRGVDNNTSGKSGRQAGRALSQLSSEYYDSHPSRADDMTFIKLAADAATADTLFSATYKEVFSDVISKIARFGAGPAIAGDIHIVSAIQPELLLQNSTTVRYGEAGALLPEDHNGLGYLNLIAMIIEIEIRLRRVTVHAATTATSVNLLFIEEPEAHSHPQLQYIFIKQIKRLLSEHRKSAKLALQTIITTHSSHITAESDFADIKYFLRVGEHVEAKNMTDLETAYADDPKAYGFLKQYLTLTRAELFFADKAVLIEGDTERILMRAMMAKLDRADPKHPNPLNSQNISVVEIGAHSQVFDKFIQFTGLIALIITDIDSAKVHIGDKGTPSLHASPISEATHTSNDALIHYLGLHNNNPSQTGDLSTLVQLGADSKALLHTTSGWVPSAQGTLRLAYQCNENGYHARSFEDAFMHLNRDFITERAKEFTGLKNRKYLSDQSKTAYDLASECVDKKTHFALDLVYLDASATETTWKTPGYIIEGLSWLRQA